MGRTGVHVGAWQLLGTGNGAVAAHGALPDMQRGGCGRLGGQVATGGPTGVFQGVPGSSRVFQDHV